MTQLTVSPTQVSFSQGIYQQNSPVLYCEHDDSSSVVITAATPFHPVSHIWPDHPADKGVLVINQQEYKVIDCLVGAWHSEEAYLTIGADIPVKRDEAGWQFVVVHRINASLSITPGTVVSLKVDSDYQQALSRAHSGAHLAALALNKVLHSAFWRKAPSRFDTLGHYDFHSYAEETSFVSEDSCLDSYRLGKTLKKRGFNNDEFIAALTQVAAQVNAQLQLWLQTGAKIDLVCDGPHLTDSRYWQCQLDEHKISIPCGGTHISTLQALADITVTLAVNAAGNIDMTTRTSKSL
ncbi:alanyl-tRNA editing protein [Shewanella sp. SNU WT4]|uniref:alanyl-tRNA editing protein n=1 Tax=Shewanella sp. SNU WT4 TaxID=2590015 RepID=UPI001125C28D|nr:alanyl-tRNA editing protein [Shewanella sp. SNU WT4]QDF67973.1 alanyl-tRNA editing protein [Shewanella sp. SNU WT4]